MDFLSFVAVALIILAVCVAMIISYSQQARRLQAIQAQLAKIEDSKPELLRQERAQWLDPLVLMEVQLNQSSEPVLDEAMLQQIEAARAAVKSLNERLVIAKEWMGAPFDLEWAEYLDRMPTLKKLYVATVFENETPTQSTHVVKE
ncbi:MAG: hypothetical protein FGM26_10090 [Beijerinckiaceae bacterium]|nr:hypothetical protein [Beijerinckiaceae bacterium]